MERFLVKWTCVYIRWDPDFYALGTERVSTWSVDRALEDTEADGTDEFFIGLVDEAFYLIPHLTSSEVK